MKRSDEKVFKQIEGDPEIKGKKANLFSSQRWSLKGGGGGETHLNNPIGQVTGR